MLHNIPDDLHKSLYHTLFESHLTYGITVWGGVTNNKLLPLFRIQKKCLRILFGDKEAYLDKFKTSARIRLFEEQKLGEEFFKREHSELLFTKHSVMNVRNLFVYHCFKEIFKILKFRTPISLFEVFELSKRNGRETCFINPEPLLNFTYQPALIWKCCQKSTSA